LIEKSRYVKEGISFMQIRYGLHLQILLKIIINYEKLQIHSLSGFDGLDYVFSFKKLKA
jgi:hypothetical protein